MLAAFSPRSLCIHAFHAFHASLSSCAASDVSSYPICSVIAVLHLFEARSLGVFQFILSLIGIYASWENVTSRIPFITVYAVGCLIWAVLDAFYLFLLVSASSKGLRSAAIGLIASNTFPNLSSALETFFKSLAESTHFFSIFSSMVSVFFDAVASYWAFSLYSDAKHILATSDFRVPLLRSQPPPHRSGIAGFGSLSRPSPPPQNTPRSMHPFAGRGYRLGFGDN